MSSNENSKNTVQGGVKPSEDDPVPRVKLPDNLQKHIDDEETLLEQIYDGTYVA